MKLTFRILLAISIVTQFAFSQQAAEPNQSSKKSNFDWEKFYSSFYTGAHVGCIARLAVQLYGEYQPACSTFTPTPHESFALQQLEQVIAHHCPKMGISKAPQLLLTNDIKVMISGQFGESCASANDINNTIAISKKFFNHSAEEQKAILAHELSHIKHRDHLARMLFFPSVFIGATCLAHLASYSIDKLGNKLAQAVAQKGWTRTSNAIHMAKKGSIIFVRSPIVVTLLSILLHKKLIPVYSRYQEKRADIYAAQYAKAAQGLISDLSKLNDDRQALDIWHPLPSERIAYLKPYLNQK